MSEKWWDMSDDELDDLFREASDKVEIPFESSSFDKLRHKMNAQPQPESPKGFGRRWLLLLAGLFFLVGVGLVYRFGGLNEGDLMNKNEVVSNTIIENSDKEKTKLNLENQEVRKNILSEKVEKISSSQNTQGTIENSTDSKGNESSIKISTTEKGGVSKSHVKAKTNQSYLETQTKSGEQSIITKKQDNQSSVREFSKTNNQTKIREESNVTEGEKEIAISEKNITKDEIVNPSEKTKTYTENPDNQSVEGFSNSKNSFEKTHGKSKNNKKSYSSNSKTNGLFQSIEGQSVFITKTKESIIPKENTNEETVVRTNFFGADYLTNKNTKSLSTDIRAIEIQPFVDSLPRKIFPPEFSRFGVRLALAPDISTTETNYSLPLGSAFGILFEYRLTKRLTLQTGVSYSTKKYNGSFDDYHNFEGTWSKYFTTKPTSVDGGCTIIDIPINLRLNIFQKPKTTWFISSGVSTYIMPTEVYTYLLNGNTIRTVSWSDGTKYNWSVLNLSMGFEKQFSKHLYFQVEPYLKSPLKGLGRGGLNLYSSGLLFSTKYEF